MKHCINYAFYAYASKRKQGVSTAKMNATGTKKNISKYNLKKRKGNGVTIISQSRNVAHYFSKSLFVCNGGFSGAVLKPLHILRVLN